ncbi:MAG: aminodeoxychorismate/anthranilate synthase component II [Planctomycetes bacterium]|nr:aminodeoxychorismate/anthranilate synthase component II [Planctomycetota bacterium]
MRVLLIDNYDSFAWNLVQALRVLGVDVVVRRNDAVSVSEAFALTVDSFVLSPGPGAPSSAGVSIPLVRAAAAAGVPLLGVCLGHQAIVEALGGSVVRASRLVHGKTSWVTHDGGSEFAGVATPFEAMRYHSLVAGDPLPRELVETSRTAPVGGAIDATEPMGVRHRTLPLVGWQFHPESHFTPAGPRLLSNFIRVAAAAGAAHGDALGATS